MIVGIASSIFFQSVLPGIVCWVFMNIIVFYLEFYPPAFGVAGGGYAGGGAVAAEMGLSPSSLHLFLLPLLNYRQW